MRPEFRYLKVDFNRRIVDLGCSQIPFDVLKRAIIKFELWSRPKPGSQTQEQIWYDRISIGLAVVSDREFVPREDQYTVESDEFRELKVLQAWLCQGEKE